MTVVYPALAPTILVRHADVKDVSAIARVQVDSWHVAQKGIPSAHTLVQPSYAQRETLWRDVLTSPVTDRLTTVATTTSGQIVGFACASLDCAGQSQQGEIRALHVAPCHQRHGVGRQLLKSVATEFWERGLSGLLVWVLAACPSRRFYEAQGARYLWQQDTEIEGQRFVELAYGWKSLARLMAG